MQLKDQKWDPLVESNPDGQRFFAKNTYFDGFVY